VSNTGAVDSDEVVQVSDMVMIVLLLPLLLLLVLLLLELVLLLLLLLVLVLLLVLLALLLTPQHPGVPQAAGRHGARAQRALYKDPCCDFQK